jgi:hypothetical protein
VHANPLTGVILFLWRQYPNPFRFENLTTNGLLDREFDYLAVRPETFSKGSEHIATQSPADTWSLCHRDGTSCVRLEVVKDNSRSDRRLRVW